MILDLLNKAVFLSEIQQGFEKGNCGAGKASVKIRDNAHNAYLLLVLLIIPCLTLSILMLSLFVSIIYLLLIDVKRIHFFLTDKPTNQTQVAKH